MHSNGIVPLHRLIQSPASNLSVISAVTFYLELFLLFHPLFR